FEPTSDWARGRRSIGAWTSTFTSRAFTFDTTTSGAGRARAGPSFFAPHAASAQRRRKRMLDAWRIVASMTRDPTRLRGLAQEGRSASRVRRVAVASAAALAPSLRAGRKLASIRLLAPVGSASAVFGRRLYIPPRHAW